MTKGEEIVSTISVWRLTHGRHDYEEKKRIAKLIDEAIEEALTEERKKQVFV